MAIRVALNHKTHYHYDRLVELGPQIIRLRPAPHCRTKIVSYSMNITPADHFLNWQQDPQSNYLARLIVNKPVRHFGIDIEVIADLSPINPFDYFLEESAANYPFEYSPSLKKELRPYFAKMPMRPLFEALYESIDKSERQTNDFVAMVNQKVNQALGYTIRMDPGIYSPERLLKVGKGSCRDFAWLLVHLFRRLGFASRFVSGYSIQIAPDEKPVDLDAPAGVSEDVCDLHAWTEVYLPGAGWVGVDPTSGLFCGEGHIPLATSADAKSASPIEGGLSECKTEFDIGMTVTRIHEDPRVTKPYTEGQWQSIVDLGYTVDKRLDKNDVRLTMGGEPTFVSTHDQEGEEWNTEAVGPTKKPLSDKFIHRIRKRIAPGGLLHYGQGKWYPGELLPRWEIGLYWRKDGVPVWEDDTLIGDETVEYGYTQEDAKEFTDELTKQLQVDGRYVRPAYEDPVRYALRERDLPVNVKPEDSKLSQAREREQLLKVFENGFDDPIGFVLPIERGQNKRGKKIWQSGLWMLRSKRLYLIPGDSPIGLRLPVDRLPWVKEEDYPYQYPNDPTHYYPELPKRRAVIMPQERDHPNAAQMEKLSASMKRKPAASFQQVYGEARQDQLPKSGESAAWVVRTALCVECRKGRIYIFMPPVEAVEDYLELIAAIEHAAKLTDKKVIIEGYTPPHDPRVEYMKITPDPGVIEVNIHPAYSWGNLISNTQMLYEEARKLHLGTDKFQLDGRHTGTGGGNHIVVGGSSPADSPFLRRPDVLKSLIGFWTNHPSLSYLFSGLFIGPTSQAPRMDEGRPDAAYELDIAFRQVPRAGEGHIPPWLVDRLFRHLLTDLTGNTHRAEFCIDKLFSPDSTTGRLGLVEFRGFEMPPHARMSLTQQLLLRALIVHFWEKPYEAPLIRWQTKLHDRFMLHHFVKEDFKEVLSTLHDAGFAFQTDWFTTHMEFRFARVGTVNYDGVQIELRQGIEPWLVLGEEAAGGGTARYVDSSLERIQVKVTGLDENRHAIAVNGIEMPLTPTGQPGEFVAGVRYRAWQPPNCLHPTIPVHAPLVVNLVDRIHSKVIGGCKYNVSHPGGRSHERFPVNALEAETRRAERFTSIGTSTGAFQMRTISRSSEMPVTLDLRRQ
ncbi:MAG: DUF2126 domain-containing protein [Opitutaceae bacterium]